MKKCFRCNTVKPLDAFYKHPEMADGHLNKCIECTKPDVRRNRRVKAEYYRRYDMERFRNDPKRRAQHKANCILYTIRHADRRHAHAVLHNAVKSGKVVKGPCAVCGEKRVEGHHFDYSKPLEVIWLCKAHHNAIHHPEKPVFTP
jgi:hypothetical protein